jgi:DNA repair protein RadC
METKIIREVAINYRSEKPLNDTLKGPESVAHFVRTILPDNSREHFIALYLNASHKVIAYSVVSTGTANATLVHPREVYQAAVLLGAIALIVSHNHPSGDVTPSSEDFKITRQLKEAGEILGIRLLDHLVVAEANYFSFNEDGKL